MDKPEDEKVEKSGLVKNASDKKQIKSAKLKRRTRRDQELNDIRAVFNLPAGRRLMWRILEQCGVYRDNVETSANVYRLLGKRSIGLFIIKEIKDADQGLYPKLMQEIIKKGEHNVN